MTEPDIRTTSADEYELTDEDVDYIIRSLREDGLTAEELTQ